MKFYILFKVLTVRALALWALAAMNQLEPNTPYKDTYVHTADVFARSALSSPLFAGEDGPKKTVALYLGVSWFESRFDPKAKGDGTCLEWKSSCSDDTKDDPRYANVCTKTCVKRGPPNSFCLGQVNRSNFKGLGVTEETLLEGEKNAEGTLTTRTGTEVCVDAMNRMMKRSMQVCATEPLENRLGWYAAGGEKCTRGFRESAHRMNKAHWLFWNIPTPPESDPADRF